jgi:hypothetical protein
MDISPVNSWIWSTPKCDAKKCNESAHDCDGSQDIKRLSHPGVCRRNEVIVKADDAELGKVHGDIEKVIGSKSDLDWNRKRVNRRSFTCFSCRSRSRKLESIDTYFVQRHARNQEIIHCMDPIG